MRYLIIFLALSTQAVFAHEGGGSISGGTRGGGNSCAGDFALIGKAVYQRILHNEYFKKNLNLIALKDAITETSVRVTTEAITDAENVRYEAANYPNDKIILIHQDWCKERLSNPKAKLIFHEYLGIAFPGLDKGFNISGKLFSETGLTEANFQNLLLTDGTDASVLKIDNTLYLKNSSSETLELYSSSEAKKNESRFRLIINCDVTRPELTYHKMIQNHVHYSSTFKFKSFAQCQEVFNRALLNDEVKDLDLVLGLESHSVVSTR